MRVDPEKRRESLGTGMTARKVTARVGSPLNLLRSDLWRLTMKATRSSLQYRSELWCLLETRWYRNTIWLMTVYFSHLSFSCLKTFDCLICSFHCLHQVQCGAQWQCIDMNLFFLQSKSRPQAPKAHCGILRGAQDALMVTVNMCDGSLMPLERKATLCAHIPCADSAICRRADNAFRTCPFRYIYSSSMPFKLWDTFFSSAIP